MNKTLLSKNHGLMLDAMGRFRTSSLFYETRKLENETKYPPLFTVKNKSHTVPSPEGDGLVTLPSIKEIYLSYDHIPGYEYEFALDVFGCWEHWEALQKSVVRTYIKEWRDELTIRLKANAMRTMLEASRGEGATATNAARYLAEEGYLPKKRGRTSKEELERIRKIDAGVKEDLASDMERLGLNVINGGK